MEARGTAGEEGDVTPWAGQAPVQRWEQGRPPRCSPSSLVLAGLGLEWDQEPGWGSGQGRGSGQRQDQDAGGCSCAEQQARCTAAHGGGCSIQEERRQKLAYVYLEMFWVIIISFISMNMSDSESIVGMG